MAAGLVLLANVLRDASVGPPTQVCDPLTIRVAGQISLQLEAATLARLARPCVGAPAFLLEEPHHRLQIVGLRIAEGRHAGLAQHPGGLRHDVLAEAELPTGQEILAYLTPNAFLGNRGYARKRNCRHRTAGEIAQVARGPDVDGGPARIADEVTAEVDGFRGAPYLELTPETDERPHHVVVVDAVSGLAAFGVCACTLNTGSNTGRGSLAHLLDFSRARGVAGVCKNSLLRFRGPTFTLCGATRQL